MRLKSYFASTIEAAMNLARQELGPEAMLVDSRRTGPESWHVGEYEVVCALFQAKTTATPALEKPVTTIFPPTGFRAPSLDKLSQEVSDLKRYMEKMATTLTQSGAGFANLRANPELAEIFAILTSSDVDSAIAHDIVTRIGNNSSPDANLPALLDREIDKLLAVDGRLGRTGARQAVVALVGPPGAGKTTCLVKLAAQYGLATRRPTQILTLDTYRIAAAEQLRSYAAILGIGFQVVENTLALAQALEEHRQKDLILIDTPGFGRHDVEDAAEMAKFFSTHPTIDTHLVLPACVKSVDLKRTASAYEKFRPSKLLFTKLDETGTFGPILNLVVSLGKPVSFLSYGQQIPEDFGCAEKSKLVELILRKDSLAENLKSAVAAA